MYALFETQELVTQKLNEIEFNYPNDSGDEYYAMRPIRMDVNGKYYLPIHPDYMAYFAGCTIVESVKPQEVEDEID